MNTQNARTLRAGQLTVMGCSPMSMSIEGCDFSPKLLIVRINDAHPTMATAIAIDALLQVPGYRSVVEHLVVEQSFSSNQTTAGNDHYRQVTAEDASIEKVRTILTQLSFSLRSLALLRESVDPLHPRLDSKRILDHLCFPSLQYLVIYGPPDTTTRFNLEPSLSFAPHLRRLQLPSDMLSCRLSYIIRSAFPELTHLDVHPLRPDYTIDQLDALFKLGEYLGVFTAGCAVSQAGYSPPSPRTTEGALHMYVYVDPLSKRRLQEVARFKTAVEERLAEGAEDRYRLHVVEHSDEPSLREMTHNLDKLYRGRRAEDDAAELS